MLLIEPCFSLTLLSFRQASDRLCSPVRQERDGPTLGSRPVLHLNPRAEALGYLGSLPGQRKEQVSDNNQHLKKEIRLGNLDKYYGADGRLQSTEVA